MLKISAGNRHALYGSASTRAIEQALQATWPPHTLMQCAGLAVAQLAMAIAPHSSRIWVACGPGNNGGDGLEAAMQLTQWGKQVVVTWLGDPASTPGDALASYHRAVQAGVVFDDTPPARFDLGIDALLGLGARLLPPVGVMAEWINTMNSSPSPTLAVDIPTGLCADTGESTSPHVAATHTLSLLTLKPGLFTAQGRDASGIVWWDALGDQPAHPFQACQAPIAAWLAPAPVVVQRAHASHKGSFGDVAVIGGAQGMTGAALLAATSTLFAGAGRVFVGLLDHEALHVDLNRPELMFRKIDALDLNTLTVVCGCGGGTAVDSILPRVLSSRAPVVLDADAITRIASNTQFKRLLQRRANKGLATVMTPHPLEAARLLGVSTHQVQINRLYAVQQLAEDYQCTVVLKGSGSITSAPGQIPFLNPTGNARLATAGTGDVLAGRIGARLASGENPFDAAWQAVYEHGLMADQWADTPTRLVAGDLALHH